MISKTKYPISQEKIGELFEKAGLGTPVSSSPLGAGEYNAVFCVTCKDKEYVLKIAPPPEIPVLTYEKDMMRSEITFYELMKEKTKINTPEIYFKDFSRTLIPCDWFIMEKIDGATLDKAELSPEEKKEAKKELAKMLSELHSVKGEKFGYLQNGLFDDWYSALRSIFENLLSDCAKKGKKSKRGERALALLDKYQNVLKTAESTLINYDLWEVNVICKKENGENRLFWIDPERSFFGDRIFDFICLDFMLPFSKKDEAKRAYNAVSDVKIGNSREEQIRFAFADLLMGLIQETEKYYRYTPKNFGWWRNVVSSKVVYKRGFGVLEK